MNLTNKSFLVLFTAWLIMVLIVSYCIIINLYFEPIIVVDGVKNLIVIDKNTFLPRANFTLYFGVVITILYISYQILKKIKKEFVISWDIFWVILVVSFISIFFTLLQQINIFGLNNLPAAGLPKEKMTVLQIQQLIQSLPEYQDDSLIIYQNGVVESKDADIQSVIIQMYTVPFNLGTITNEAKRTSLPVGYFGYKLAMVYYEQMYPNKFKK